MASEFIVRWERDPETGALTKIREVITITESQRLRRRYGLPDDATDAETNTAKTAADTVTNDFEALDIRARAMPFKLASYNPVPIILEIRQRQDALEAFAGVVTIAALRPILRTILNALVDVLINQHRIMVALRYTARQIADE